MTRPSDATPFIREAAHLYRVSQKAIRSRRRTAKLTEARHFAMLRAFTECHSYEAVGRMFLRDQNAVRNIIRKLI